MKKQAYTVFGLQAFLPHKPSLSYRPAQSKGANLPILGRQRGNAACLRPSSHAVFLHIVLHSCEGAAGGGVGGGRTSLSGK